MKILRRWFGILIGYSLLSVNVFLSAQSPGGVSSNLNLWLKADAGTSSTMDGADVDTWSDQSGNANNGSSSFFSTKPAFAEQGINYNPSISFDGTGAGFLLPNNTYPVADENYSIYVVLKSILSPGLHTIVNQGPWAFPFNHHIYLDSIGGLTDDSWGPGADHVSPAGTMGTSSTLVSFHYNTASNSKSTFTRGQLVSSTSAIPDLNHSTMGHVLGAGYFASYMNFFQGQMSEVVVFSSDLTNPDNQRVMTYLALKYGITLGTISSTLDYVDSDGTSIWTGTSTYQNDIAGIGRDDASALNQKQSRSVNDDAILSIGLVSVAVTNSLNPNNFASDKTFLVWGNDNGSLSEVSSDLPQDTDSRLEREWSVQATGTVSNLAIQFDLTGITHSGSSVEDFVLAIDRDGDGDFTSGATIVDASSYASQVVTFSNVTLYDGDVFTLSAEENLTVPGGVSTPLQVWYKADAGVSGSPVSSWSDHSGNHYDLDGSNGPDRVANLINYHPGLFFDGISEYLKVDEGILRSGTFNDITVFVVNRTDAVMARVIFEQMFSGSRKIGANIPWDNSRAYFNIGLNGSNTLAVDWSSVNGQPALWAHCSSTGTATLTGSEKSTHLNGLEMGTINGRNSGLTGEVTPFYVGAKNPSQRWYEGNISELIIFTGTMTALEFQRTNSYLAIKYGLTLSENTDNDGTSFESPNADGNYEGDYLSSGGIAVWDASLNQSYHNDVAGIGLDVLSGLNQKQSRSSNGDVLAMGLGEIAGSHANNSHSFTVDESYLLWGHNSDGLTEISSELPSGIVHRLEREWRVQETGTPGGVTVQYYLSGITLTGGYSDEFKLLIDTDGDGDFTTGSISQLDAASLVNDTLTFTNVDFSSGDCFTLGEVPNLPPNITSTPPDSVEVLVTYSYNVTSEDPEGDARVLSALSIPAFLSFVDNGDGTGILSGTPACADLGDHTIVLNVNDGLRDSTHTYVLTVWGSDTEDPVISGNQQVCTPVQEIYTITDPGDHTFLWTVTNGTIVGSATDLSAVVEWTGTTQGTIDITVTSSSGCINNDNINVDKYSTPVSGDASSSITLIRR